MSYQGFGKASGPSAPPKLQHSFGTSSRPDASPPRPPRVQSHSVAFQATGTAPTLHHQYDRPILFPRRSVEEQNSSFKAVDAQSRPSLGITSVATLQTSDHVVSEVAHPHTKRSRSPTYMPGDEKLSKIAGHPVIRRPVSSSPTFEDQPKMQGFRVNSYSYQDQSLSERPYDHDTNILTGFGNVRAPKGNRSPEKPSANDLRSAQSNLQRPSLSPPRSFSRLNAHEVVGSTKNVYAESEATKPTSIPVPKRTRSPPLPSSNLVFGGNSHSTCDDAERERLAKAKRLARFKDELVEAAPSNLGSMDERDNANKNEHLVADRNKYKSNLSLELLGNMADGNMPDYEALESSSIIVGLCPDMCPESERAERERKGDLDHYERLDGDRNHSSKLLAVKKYNRTAEREANLIRPMPILLKTIDYLLNLLNQPYDEKFLGTYNFLWDRMRAIRMDLRMQHLFNEDAITMLEQMIRLHIIAMHELCEFSKGEGFAEGFDAHLNIEQMNKTSVELFQMYDDHRKRGIIVPSEKEFRGYYALLKLDKHPGYKVEPAELSLDLAKMTHEMRQTPEVKFARDVARACRTSNFIAFFRLVRKASYLQACLMHAHFAKLRTQALASLHSGLQNNQGLPISHVCKWIGMEEEDIEGLLEYHGFLIKIFEEPYMVREGPFLNSDKDFATKCSKLVHMKRSSMIVNDVSPCSQNKHLIPGATKEIPSPRIRKEPQTFSIEKISSPHTVSIEKESLIHVTDEEMIEFDDQPTPVDHKKVQPVFKKVQPFFETPKVIQPFFETPKVSQWHEYNHKVDGALLQQSDVRSCKPLKTEVKFVGNQNYDSILTTSPMRNISTGVGVSFRPVSEASLQNIPVCGFNDSAMERVDPQILVNNVMEDKETLYVSEENKQDIVMENRQDEEIANAKLKLILRLWRRRSLKKKQVREQRILAAKAALSKLSVGPPVQLNNQKIKSIGVFDIDHTLRERWKKQQLSWSMVNVSDVVASTISRRNVDVKCICWKLVICSQMDHDLDQRSQDSRFAAGYWLLHKLMPSKANDLVVSSSFLSIWKSWISSKTGANLSCFLSVVKDTKFDNLTETVHGASAILFVATDSLPWELQRVRLHKLLMSIPSGSCLPLLILSDLHDEVSASSMLVNELGLYDIDKSRIHSFQVVSLLENPHLRHLGFFSDEKLKEGLKWLANESPPQPALHRVKVLDLIITHLNSSMEVLNSMREKDISPNQCISAFNLALDQSLVDVTAAAKENPSNWPCPEIALLEESSDEHTITVHALPPVGWSSVKNVEPLKHALMDLKLPSFPDMSWLSKGSNIANEIPIQRDDLESCLISYLNQTSEIMEQQLAMEEAHIMLQKCAKLELHEFKYFIIPDWMTIFRRILNWRLRFLAGWSSSYVHIVDCCHSVSLPSDVKLECREPPVYRPNQPLLDEVIEAACSSLSIDQRTELPGAQQPLAAIISNGRPSEVAAAAIDFPQDDSNSTREIGFVSSESVPNLGRRLSCTGKELVSSSTVCSEVVRLNELLDRCNELQGAIGKKLSIYF